MKKINSIVKFCLYALVLCIMVNTTHAQDDEKPPMLNVGDIAPALQIRKWFKGTPVKEFEKGKIYVIEFWATWCRPCKAAMPRTSALARAYKDTVTFIGVDIMEMPNTTLQRVQKFVDSMDSRMDYAVAAQDSNFMAVNWMNASGAETDGIPKVFIINGDGKLAWIGEPYKVDEVLRKVIDNTWDVSTALANRNYNRHIKHLDYQASYRLSPFAGDATKLDYIGQPDTILAIIDTMTKKEPGLKYAPIVGAYTFTALLKTNMQKALEFGKTLITTPTYEEPNYEAVTHYVDFYTGKVYMPPEAYNLAAEAYQLEIDHVPYPEIDNMFKKYYEMTNLWLRANNKAQAVASLEKSLEWLKNE